MRRCSCCSSSSSSSSTPSQVQQTARKSALLVVRLRDGTFRTEVLENLDHQQAGYTSKQLLANTKSEIEFVQVILVMVATIVLVVTIVLVQVMVVIDARPHLRVSAISHKQFVEHVGAQHVADRAALEKLAQAKAFTFAAEATTVEQAEKEICRSLRLKDCQAWYVAEDGLCRKRQPLATDPGELAGYMRHDAIARMVERLAADITAARGRAAYTGKGGDETDRFLAQLGALGAAYRAPNLWIMLEKEFKDEPDKLVSSVCKFDSATGGLSYCGTICLQVLWWWW